nr:WYL domain-containing protein [Nocardioides perillae]
MLDGEGDDHAPLDPALGARVAEAAANGRQVRLTYWTPSRDEVSERTVDPRGVVRHGGHAYLDAWCHAAEAPRLFRLDRVRDAAVLDAPVVSEPVPPRDLEAEGLFATSPEAPTVTLRLAPRAQWVPEYYPVEAVRPQADGTLEVDLVVADPRWLDRLVLRLAPHARVVGPQEFTRSSTAAAAETLRLYG